MKKNRSILLLTSTRLHLWYPTLIRHAQQHNWRINVEERSAPPANWRGNGVIVMAARHPATFKFIGKLRRQHVPAVELINIQSSTRLPSVTVDAARSAQFAADYLKHLNYTNVALFGIEKEAVHNSAFRHFEHNWGSPPPLHWFWAAESKRPNDRDALERWIAKKLKSAPKPLAVYCFNDYNAVVLEEVCLHLKLSIPHDVAILGDGNVPVHCETARIPISSISHDRPQMMRTAIELLERMMQGRTVDPKTVIEIPALGIAPRQSTDGIAVRSDILRDAVKKTVSVPAHAGTSHPIRSGDYRQLNKLSHTEFGTSYHKLITLERIRKAAVMLNETDEKIATIALECGFCSASHFINVFRASCGQSPAAWRKRKRNRVKRP